MAALVEQHRGPPLGGQVGHHMAIAPAVFPQPMHDQDRTAWPTGRARGGVQVQLQAVWGGQGCHGGRV